MKKSLCLLLCFHFTTPIIGIRDQSTNERLYRLERLNEEYKEEALLAEEDWTAINTNLEFLRYHKLTYNSNIEIAKQTLQTFEADSVEAKRIRNIIRLWEWHLRDIQSKIRNLERKLAMALTRHQLTEVNLIEVRRKLDSISSESSYKSIEQGMWD